MRTNFYLRRTNIFPLRWKKGQKPSATEMKMVTSLTNDALSAFRQTVRENEIKTAFSVLSGGLKSQFGADEKSTAFAYFYAFNGISS
ncbi:hypothetical protein V3564_00170 [Bartonella sp. B12(2025)]